MKKFLFFISVLISGIAFGQKDYKDSIGEYIKNYVAKHEVVTGADKKFLSFFPVNEKFRVEAMVKRVENSPWFKMQTSGLKQPLYRLYAVAHFKIDGKDLQLNIYQSQQLMSVEEYKSYLFLPFTDLTSGKESYLGGKYIDISLDDIKDGRLVIDFNKAYNPYCAYVSDKYNCPIPPKENDLNIAIEAGEKNYGKAH